MRGLAIFILSVLLAATLAGQAASQSAITPEMRSAANDAYQKQDWKAAAAAYEKIAKAEDKNAGRDTVWGRPYLD